MNRIVGWTSRRKKWTVAGMMLALGLWGALGWVTRRRVYRTVGSSAAALDRAGLTDGASVARVVAVLDSLHATRSALRPDGTMGARLGPSVEDFLVSGDIYVEFTFDSAGRLHARRVKERFTGP